MSYTRAYPVKNHTYVSNNIRHMFRHMFPHRKLYNPQKKKGSTKSYMSQLEKNVPNFIKSCVGIVHTKKSPVKSKRASGSMYKQNDLYDLYDLWSINALESQLSHPKLKTRTIIKELYEEKKKWVNSILRNIQRNGDYTKIKFWYTSNNNIKKRIRSFTTTKENRNHLNTLILHYYKEHLSRRPTVGKINAYEAGILSGRGM